MDAPASARLPLRVWVLASLAFVAVYGFMWTTVHVYVDLRPCQLRLDDPLFALIPYDRRFYYVTHDLYYAATALGLGWLLLQAWRGDHTGIVRWGAALSVQAALRSITITLLPLCRVTVPPASAAIEQIPRLELGLFSVPWRVWASNDLVFSGHVGEFLLLFWAIRSWPPGARAALVVFQIVQVYALLATRGHYTIDVVLAVPCAYFADGVAVAAIARLSRGRAVSPALQAERARAPSAAISPAR